MINGANNKLRSLVMALLLSAGVWGAGQVPNPRLPALARVLETDNTSTTWRESGEVAGGFAIVCRDFEGCLAGQGWYLERRIPVGQGLRHAVIQQWRRDGSQVLVMLWDAGLAKTGFAWGTEIGKKEKAKIQKPGARSLKSGSRSLDSSANGAIPYQPGATPQEPVVRKL
jgi:hypothetical protein